jgi:FAD/FMN-containing dehydrogenase
MANVKVSEAQVSNNVGEEIIARLKEITGADHVIIDEESRVEYGHDKTEDYQFLPDLVIKPGTPQEISAILKICNEHKIPVTPRGAGTGLSGGALPVKKGVVISMERFNKILNIDELNLQATVEPGVITEVFQNAVKEKGLFYPPDPASRWQSGQQFRLPQGSEVWRYPRLCNQYGSRAADRGNHLDSRECAKELHGI